jgi:hypothetical protein
VTCDSLRELFLKNRLFQSPAESYTEDLASRSRDV